MTRTFLFDFGNVLYRFDPDALIAAYAGSADDRAMLASAIWPDWPALDGGELDYGEAKRRALRALPGRLHAAAEEFYATWHLRMGPVAGMKALLCRLREQGSRLLLLSNAPARLAEVTGDLSLLDGFEGCLFSGCVHLTKPDPAIFRLAIERFDLTPRETLFIDDLAPNLEGARQAGLQTHPFTTAAALEAYIFGGEERVK